MPTLHLRVRVAAGSSSAFLARSVLASSVLSGGLACPFLALSGFPAFLFSWIFWVSGFSEFLDFLSFFTFWIFWVFGFSGFLGFLSFLDFLVF